MFNILIWSPQTSWVTTYFSPHLYVFKTHYKYHGQFPNQVNWFTFDTYQVTLEQLQTSKPDAILLGVYPWNKSNILEFVQMCQTNMPHVPIFIGGVTISFYDLSEFNHLDNILGIVQGEGEVPVTMIVDRLVNNQPLDNIPGLWVRHAKQFVKPTLEAPRISYKHGIGPKQGNFFEIEYSWLLDNQQEIFHDINKGYANNKDALKTETYFFWESARGCPYECVYCDWGGGLKTKVRRKPWDQIVQELDVVFRNLEQFTFHVTDANFGIFKQDIDTAKAIRDIMQKYNRVGKASLFFTFAKNNHDTVKIIQEVLLPVKSDMPWSLDIQSTDQGVLDSVKRKQSTFPIIAEKYDLKNNNTFYTTNFMLGLPGTTLEKDFKTMCDIIDQNSQLNSFLTMIPPQSEMASPEYLQEWQAKLFKTQYDHVTLNTLILRPTTNVEMMFMYQCKSFSVSEFIDILIINEFLQLLEGCYITKFARLLAKQNGFDAHAFYTPFIDKLFTDADWLGIDVNDIRKSISDWIFNQQPFGIINGELFASIILKRMYMLYHFKNFKQKILSLVGHMDSEISSALDIGFLTIPMPIGPIKKSQVSCNLVYEKYPKCQLKKVPYTNTISVTSTVTDIGLIELSKRIARPLSLDTVIFNQENSLSSSQS